MKLIINTRGFVYVGGDRKDEIQTIEKIIRLPYVYHSLLDCHMYTTVLTLHAYGHAGSYCFRERSWTGH
jgi:hypothetical protein